MYKNLKYRQVPNPAPACVRATVPIVALSQERHPRPVPRNERAMSAPESMSPASLEGLLSRALGEASCHSAAAAAAAIAEGDVTPDVCVLFERCFRAMGGEWAKQVRSLRAMRNERAREGGGRVRGQKVEVQVKVEVEVEAEEVALETAGEGVQDSAAVGGGTTDALIAKGAKVGNALQNGNSGVVVSAATSRSGRVVAKKDESVVVGAGERAVDDGNSVGITANFEGAVAPSRKEGIELPRSCKKGDIAAAASSRANGNGNCTSGIGNGVSVSVSVDLPPPREKGSNGNAATGLTVPGHGGNGDVAVGKTASELDQGAVASRPDACAAVSGDSATTNGLDEAENWKTTGPSGSGVVSAPMLVIKAGASGSGSVKRNMKVKDELDAFSKRRKGSNGASPSASTVQSQPVEEAGPLVIPVTGGRPCL